MDSNNHLVGHAKRLTKTVIVKEKAPRKPWTNRTTKLIEKYCNIHEKTCEFSENAKRCKITRNEEYLKKKRKNKPTTNENILCKGICEKILSPDNFYSDPSNPNGISYLCKICKKDYDRKRNNTWPVLIRAAYRTSIKTHGNKKEENQITLEKCKELLKEQNYKCNHCEVELTCIQGTVINASYERASLDRIDTNIMGYGNGNAQWLCVSCNKGKCTMPDEKHKEKFKIKENKKLKSKIKELENRIKELELLN